MHDAPTEHVAGVTPAGPRGVVGLRSRALTATSSIAPVVAVASGASLILGLIRLGTPSLWIDESFTALVVGGPLSGLWEQLHAFHYGIVMAWGSLAGTSEWALRFPSVVGAMLASGLLVVLAHRLFDRRVALASGLLLATSPFLVHWSQQARSYTMLLAVSVLAMLLLVRALDDGSRAAWAAYGLAFSAVIVLHPVSGLALVVPHAVFVLQRRDRLSPHALIAPNLVVALGIPWAGIVGLWTRSDKGGVSWIEFPSAVSVAESFREVSGAAGLGLALALVGLWALRRAGRTDLAVWLGTWAFAPFAVTLVASIVKPMFLDRYLIVAAPAFALLGGFAVWFVGSRLRTALVLALVVATGAGLLYWYSQGRDGNWRGEDWRAASEAVLDRRAGGEPVLVVPWSSAPAARYYGVPAVDVSTADSMWVLRWSEEGGAIPAQERSGLGFGRHRLVERLDFGWRLSAQHWVRSP